MNSTFEAITDLVLWWAIIAACIASVAKNYVEIRVLRKDEKYNVWRQHQ